MKGEAFPDMQIKRAVAGGYMNHEKQTTRKTNNEKNKQREKQATRKTSNKKNKQQAKR
ncbi:MAG: hypothetical protein FWE54_02000 [Methanimicrococcus sp.]|nr:hypothetical protein [Methanimicrococcus sp.]